jgi:hypothetical protein
MSDSPIDAFINGVDALDFERVFSLFAPHGTLSMAYGKDASGIDQVRTALGSFFKELRATHHDVSSVWNPEPGVWIAEMTATYELSDFSRRGPYKRAIIVRSDDAGIESLRIYGAHEAPMAPDRSYTEVYGPSGWLPTL